MRNIFLILFLIIFGQSGLSAQVASSSGDSHEELPLFGLWWMYTDHAGKTPLQVKYEDGRVYYRDISQAAGEPDYRNGVVIKYDILGRFGNEWMLRVIEDASKASMKEFYPHDYWAKIVKLSVSKGSKRKGFQYYNYGMDYCFSTEEGPLVELRGKVEFKAYYDNMIADAFANSPDAETVKIKEDAVSSCEFDRQGRLLKGDSGGAYALRLGIK